MKITLLQRNIIWADAVQNVQRADAAIDAQPGADLYILPEMFSTGFCTQPEGIAEPVENATLQWMQQKAKTINAAIAGSIAISENGRFYNRFYFVKPDGNIQFYNKKHLFTYGGEDERFQAGEERVVVEYRGVRFLLEVCYDLRFPVWSRNRGDYDVILYVASWPTSRVEAWSALLRARAIENQCYVLGVNRVGTDPACDYCGGTAAIDAYGRTLAECERNKECEVTADIDMERLKAFRQKFPVLNDADEFELK